MQSQTVDAFADIRMAVINEFVPSRERALVLTKLDEAELWATRCPRDDDDTDIGGIRNTN